MKFFNLTQSLSIGFVPVAAALLLVVRPAQDGPRDAVLIVLAVSFMALGLHRRPGQNPLWTRWSVDMRPGLVVGITIPLVLSWLVSVYFVPYLGVRLLKVKPAAADGADHQAHFDTPFYKVFRRAVNACVQLRWLTIGATLLTFSLGIVGMGQVQQQFFPDSARPEILVDIWFPEGTSFAANQSTSRRVDACLMEDAGVTSVSTWI